jgi:hypothetical protein
VIPPIIHVSAVAAPQIFDEELLATPSNARVLAADISPFQRQGQPGRTPDNHLIRIDLELASCTRSYSD